jgi:hypothetical protein
VNGVSGCLISITAALMGQRLAGGSYDNARDPHENSHSQSPKRRVCRCDDWVAPRILKLPQTFFSGRFFSNIPFSPSHCKTQDSFSTGRITTVVFGSTGLSRLSGSMGSLNNLAVLMVWICVVGGHGPNCQRILGVTTTRMI